MQKILVQYLLATCSKKNHAREEQLRTVIGKGSKAEKREEVFTQAKVLLKDVLGIDVVYENKKYWVFNSLKLDKNECLHSDSESDDELDGDAKSNAIAKKTEKDNLSGIVMLLLTYIFMLKKDTSTEPGISEEPLLELISAISTDDPNLVDKFKSDGVKTKELESAGWIKLTKDVDVLGIQSVFFDWGPLALRSIDPLKCMEYFVDIYGGTFEDWPDKVEAANKQRDEYLI